MSEDAPIYRHQWRIPAEEAPATKALLAGLPRRVPAADARRLEELATRVEAASCEAKRFVEAAREEAVRIREEARREGRQAGYEEVVVGLARVRAEEAAMAERSEKELVELAFRVAGRILGRVVESTPEVVADVVSEALAHARGRRAIVVNIHPADLPLLERELGRLERRVNGVPITFETTEDIDRGGAVIETDAGRIDARLEEQLVAMRAAILGGGEHG